MRILIACEESQTVCKAFREKGHEAYSCDIQDCSGGHPEWHIKGDVLIAIDGWRKVIFSADCIYEDWDEEQEFGYCPSCQIDYSKCLCPGPTQDGIYDYCEINGDLYAREKNWAGWNMMIAFPPCTYLCSSGLHWNKRVPGREEKTKEAIEFAKKIFSANIPLIALENSIGCLSTHIGKPTQIIQPYNFGENASKATCLWLKGLPILKNTNYYPPRIVNGKKRWGNQTDSGQNKLTPSPTRGIERSKTFSGIAVAMVEQWGDIKPAQKQMTFF